MSKNDVWYGYLEAGAKSTPVVRDDTLESKSRNTVYLYNFIRGMFLEYSIAIVETKLRELKPDDISLEELSSAFKSARKVFNPGKAAKSWRDTAPAPAAVIDNSDDTDIPSDMDSWDDEFIDDDE